MTWNVEVYTTAAGKDPVEDFIVSLSVKEQAKVIRTIEMLEQFGTGLKMPHSCHIEGVDGLFELRTIFSNNIHRIFYFYWLDKTFVLLHGFTKKTQKTPKSEITTALKRRADWLERRGQA